MSRTQATPFWQKLLLVLLGCALVVLCEIGFRLFHIPKNLQDPFQGFEKAYPLFGTRQDDTGAQICFTNSNKLSYFNYQEFPLKKPANSFRIFCFGGSTTYGRPFRGETSFPTWLEMMLNLADSTRQYQVINAGGISYASYRIVNIVEETFQYQPDLFVIYMGHNEFLEARTFESLLREKAAVRTLRLTLNKLHLYQALKQLLKPEKVQQQKDPSLRLEEEVATLLDASAGLERYSRKTLHRQETFAQFRNNVEKIVRLAEKHKVRVLLATVPSNVRDFSPFKSELSDSLTLEQRDQFRKWFLEGQAQQKAGRFQGALKAYSNCLKLDPHHAELLFRVGQCFWQAGDKRRARQFFLQAREEDVAPLRAPEEINRIIREVGNEFVVPVIDVAAELAGRSPGKIIGSEFLVDHVHPSIEGHQLIARLIFDGLVTRGIVPRPPGDFTEKVEQQFRQTVAALPADYFINGALNLAKVLGWAGKEQEKLRVLRAFADRLQDNPEFHYMMGNSALKAGRPKDAISHFQQALRIDPDFSEALTNLGFALEQDGRPDEALGYYLKALQRNPKDYVAQTNVGRIFYLQENYPRAIQEYEKAVRLKPDYPDARLGLGVVYYRDYHIPEAKRELLKAIELNPNYSEAYFNLGLIYMGEKDLDSAIVAFEKAITVDPGYDNAYCSLGVCYSQKGDVQKALAVLQKAVEINPRSGRAHNNLAAAFYGLGDLEKARYHAREARRLKYPMNPEFWQALFGGQAPGN